MKYDLSHIKHAAQVVLINKDGLVLHVSRKDDHNDWGLPGGKVDPEDYDTAQKWETPKNDRDPYKVAAIRETFEETGIKIHNLVEVFSMHKDGYMGHTYIAEYEGEINYDKEKEPHLVEWKPFKYAMEGKFGWWNQMVLESLNSMGIYPNVLDGTPERPPFGQKTDSE